MEVENTIKTSVYPNKLTDLTHRTRWRVQRNTAQRHRIQEKAADARRRDELKKTIAAEKEALKEAKLRLASINAELESGVSSNHRQKNPFRSTPAETNSSGKVPNKTTRRMRHDGKNRSNEQNIDHKFT